MEGEICELMPLSSPRYQSEFKSESPCSVIRNRMAAVAISDYMAMLKQHRGRIQWGNRLTGLAKRDLFNQTFMPILKILIPLAAANCQRPS